MVAEKAIGFLLMSHSQRIELPAMRATIDHDRSRRNEAEDWHGRYRNPPRQIRADSGDDNNNNNNDDDDDDDDDKRTGVVPTEFTTPIPHSSTVEQ